MCGVSSQPPLSPTPPQSSQPAAARTQPPLAVVDSGPHVARASGRYGAARGKPRTLQLARLRLAVRRGASSRQHQERRQHITGNGVARHRRVFRERDEQAVRVGAEQVPGDAAGQGGRQAGQGGGAAEAGQVVSVSLVSYRRCNLVASRRCTSPPGHCMTWPSVCRRPRGGLGGEIPTLYCTAGSGAGLAPSPSPSFVRDVTRYPSHAPAHPLPPAPAPFLLTPAPWECRAPWHLQRRCQQLAEPVATSGPRSEANTRRPDQAHSHPVT